jgi:hypothetical protein
MIHFLIHLTLHTPLHLPTTITTRLFPHIHAIIYLHACLTTFLITFPPLSTHTKALHAICSLRKLTTLLNGLEIPFEGLSVSARRKITLLILALAKNNML